MRCPLKDAIYTAITEDEGDEKENTASDIESLSPPTPKLKTSDATQNFRKAPQVIDLTSDTGSESEVDEGGRYVVFRSSADHQEQALPNDSRSTRRSAVCLGRRLETS